MNSFKRLFILAYSLTLSTVLAQGSLSGVVKDDKGTPFTQSVQSFYALEEALKEFFDQGGRTSRYEVYSRRMAKISKALNSLKVRPFLPAKVNSVVLRSFLLPSDMTYDEVHKSLKNEGFINPLSQP